MIIHCKNTLGDGTIIYVDYNALDPSPIEEELIDNDNDILIENKEHLFEEEA